MGFPKALIAGLIGGGIGAAIWAALVYYTNYEFAMVAWGLGLLVGLSVRAGAGSLTGAGTGMLAAVLALASICAGKYAVVYIIVEKEVAKVTAQMEAELAQPLTDDEAIMDIADKLVDESQAAGKKMVWPKGKDIESDRDTLADYPATIVKESKSRWNALLTSARQDYKDGITKLRREAGTAILATMKENVKGQGFSASFGVMDALFGLLAVVTAFRLGSGSEGE
jgi:hypothetical protein